MFIVLIFIIIIAFFIFIEYEICKLFESNKNSFFIVLIFNSLIGLFFLYIIFQDELFFTSKAVDYLKENKIFLKNKSKLIKYSSSGLAIQGDYFENFQLKISKEDNNIIINEIKKHKNLYIYSF